MSKFLQTRTTRQWFAATVWFVVVSFVCITDSDPWAFVAYCFLFIAAAYLGYKNILSGEMRSHV